MALYRLSFLPLIGLIIVAGCQERRVEGRGTPTPVVEAMPETKAVADVDRRATLALKQDLVTRFPQNSAGTIVEAGLTKDGFDCGPNPAANDERACLKAVREGVCEVNTIVRTSPYAPEKAQIIKVCETNPTPAK